MSMRYKVLAISALGALVLLWQAATPERPPANAGVDQQASSASTVDALSASAQSAKQQRLLKAESFGRHVDSFELEELGDKPCAPIRWESTLESALDRAQREDKPVFVSFAVRTFGDPDSPFF